MNTFIFPIGATLRSNSKIIHFGDDSPHTILEQAGKFQNDEKLDSALIYYSWLIEKYQTSTDEDIRLLVGKAFSEMGQIYYVYLNDYMSAYRCLSEAENIFKDSADKNSYAVVLLNLGNLFNMYEYIFPYTDGDSSIKSRDFYDKALHIAATIKDWDLVLSAYINSIMLDLPFVVNNRTNDNIRFLLRDSIPKSVPDYKLSLLLCEGTDAIATHDFDKALGKMIEIRDSLRLMSTREKYMARICMAAVAIGEENYEEAIKCITGIFSEKTNINDLDVHMEIYDLLAKCYALAGNREMSNFYRIKYYEVKDTLTMQLVELEPTRLGIELNNVREQALNIDNERRQVKTILIFSILLVIILMIIATIIYRKNRELRLKNQVIFNQTQSILKTSADKGEAVTAEIEEFPEKYKDSSMTDEKKENLIIKIEEVLKNVEEICDNNFSLQRLTQLVESNTSYISRAINEHYGMTFGNLLNKYRIQEACRRMSDTDKYGHLTIEAISESVGFNTRSTFTKAFRLNMGMLPSEYAKFLKNNKVV